MNGNVIHEKDHWVSYCTLGLVVMFETLHHGNFVLAIFFYVIKKELTNSVICYPLPFSFIRSVHMFRFSSVCSTKHDFSELYNFHKLQFFFHHRSTVALFVPATRYVVKSYQQYFFTKRNFF